MGKSESDGETAADPAAEILSNSPGSHDSDDAIFGQFDRDSGIESESRGSSLGRTIAEVKEHAFSRLQEELKKAHEELKLRDEEVSRLNRIRKEVESELEDLTASLFQEAHSMVREANTRRACAEKLLIERSMQIEVLTAEVAALKALVLTSTPSRPNPHLHPQINNVSRRYKRSPSHYNLKYGRENSPPESPEKTVSETEEVDLPQYINENYGVEVDPVFYKEFLSWKESPTFNKTDTFIERIFQEDIDTCLNFTNKKLALEVKNAVEVGDVFIEARNDKSKVNFPKKCALQETMRKCQYRLKLGKSGTWHYISHICRNRIIAVCELLNYLRYIIRGLVKSPAQDIYWEIIRLRKEVVHARLGLNINQRR